MSETVDTNYRHTEMISYLTSRMKFSVKATPDEYTAFTWRMTPEESLDCKFVYPIGQTKGDLFFMTEELMNKFTQLRGGEEVISPAS